VVVRWVPPKGGNTTSTIEQKESCGACRGACGALEGLIIFFLAI
tara:strand:+ start:591 stop:722 length:132 start_codon:yes stop_codon:yes gene_type:complete